MKSFYIDATRATPEIDFNFEKNELNITGESYPENASIFYREAIEWLTKYLTNIDEKIIVNIKLTYLNTSSSKILTDILEMIQTHYDTNGDIALNWYYEEDDEDSLDNGEIFLEDHTFPYNLVPFTI